MSCCETQVPLVGFVLPVLPLDAHYTARPGPIWTRTPDAVGQPVRGRGSALTTDAGTCWRATRLHLNWPTAGRRDRRRKPGTLIDQPSLYEELRQLPDHRRAPGRKHSIATVLTVYLLVVRAPVGK